MAYHRERVRARTAVLRGHVTCQEISLPSWKSKESLSPVSKGEVLWLILDLPSVRG